jgi:hypothetical protein
MRNLCGNVSSFETMTYGFFLAGTEIYFEKGLEKH